MSDRQPAIYMMANQFHGTIYTGVTSALAHRVRQHKRAATPGFTKKYQCNKLVYFELIEEMYLAIYREKQIKAGSRKKKIHLIEAENRAWEDLTYLLM